MSVRLILEVHTADEIVDVVQGLGGSCSFETDHIKLSWDDLTSRDDAEPVFSSIGKGVSSSPVKMRVGPIQKLFVFRKLAMSGVKRKDVVKVTDDMIVSAVGQCASSLGVTAPRALGDGKILEQFFAFLTEHWDEILKIILALLGLAI